MHLLTCSDMCEHTGEETTHMCFHLTVRTLADTIPSMALNSDHEGSFFLYSNVDVILVGSAISSVCYDEDDVTAEMWEQHNITTMSPTGPERGTACERANSLAGLFEVTSTEMSVIIPNLQEDCETTGSAIGQS